MGRAKTGCSLPRRKSGRISAFQSAKESDYTESNAKLSLPVISNEKLRYDDDYLMKTLKNNERPGIPKIRISCKALNYERVIDVANNNVIPDKGQKLKKAPKKKAGRPVKRKEKENKNKSLNVIKVVVRKPVHKNETGSIKRDVKESPEKMPSTKNLKTLNGSAKNSDPKNMRILNVANTDSPQINVKKPALCNFDCTAQQTNNKRKSLTCTIENSNDQSSTDMNINTKNTQGKSCSLLYLSKDETALSELSDIENFMSSLDELSMKFGDSAGGTNKNLEEDIHMVNIWKKPFQCVYSRNKNDSDLDNINGDVSLFDKISLQSIVKTFMNNPQVKYLKGSTALKRGLCISWLSNNYVCSNQQCLYNHNALNLFTSKLNKYPSKFIMTVVVSMKKDPLFVDVVLAAFKVISSRQIPVVWVTFLTFFVFYVTEPSDSRFLKFWATAARFFCDLQKNCSATSGFASLLAIFSHIEDSEKWKIIEFIKLIEQPPIQICVNFTLLQPVLKMELPLEFLTAAIESCIATQKDVLKVYCLIVPKISIMTSPIEVVELLLILCKTLEPMNRRDLADDLRKRLRGKVWSVRSKITHHKYPLTASFQEELSVNSNEENCLVPSVGLAQEKSDLDLPFADGGNDYFQPEDDFCSLVAQAVEFSTDGIPKPFRSTDDVGERQVARIKQFFNERRLDLLGKYLNELRPNMTERASEEFLRLLFQMKISLQQGVDLLKIVLLACNSHSAAKVLANVSVTFVLNLVRINEWEKAYSLVFLCSEKQINLVEGKVYHTSEFNTITQCRIALLLVEIYAYKDNYENAVDLVKKYFLFSPNNSLGQLSRDVQDETIRVRILEDLLRQITRKQLTKEAYDLFGMIWKEQKELTAPVDLRKSVNDILVLLLNQDSEVALNLYELIKNDGILNDITVRALVVTLVRRNRISDAKSLVCSSGQNHYFTPNIRQNSATVKILSFWLEEEIYAMLDGFFDLLIASKTNFNPEDYNNVEIQLEESKPNLTSRALRPLCLGIIIPSLRDACIRVQRVLQQQFNPPLKLIIMPYYLKLDEFSVKLHLCKRMKNLNC